MSSTLSLVDLQEVCVKGTFRVARVFGTDIRIHWLLPVGVIVFMQQMLPDGSGEYWLAFVLVLLLFLAVFVHEIAHALVARVFGITTRSIILWPLGGLAVFERKPLRPWQDALISLAGPASNLALGMCCALLLALWNTLPAVFSNSYDPAFGVAQYAGDYFVTFNFSLGLFNLLPIFPLDGGQILWAFLSARFGEQRASMFVLPLSVVCASGLLVLSVISSNILLAIVSLMIVAASLTLNPTLRAWLQDRMSRLRDRGQCRLSTRD